MTVELVLLLTVYAFIVLGVFLGDLGPLETFRKSGPRLAARVERNITTGKGFHQNAKGSRPNWQRPSGPAGGGQ